MQTILNWLIKPNDNDQKYKEFIKEGLDKARYLIQFSAAIHSALAKLPSETQEEKQYTLCALQKIWPVEQAAFEYQKQIGDHLIQNSYTIDTKIKNYINDEYTIILDKLKTINTEYHLSLQI
ncbi:MAG: hypothetical protein ACYCPT_07010 [Acidimicrobiales bacterium]